jgi:hypothetical protein
MFETDLNDRAMVDILMDARVSGAVAAVGERRE